MTAPSANPQLPWSAEKHRRGVYARDPEWAREAIDKLIDACHPKQRDAALDPSSWVAAVVPRGGGKSTTALVRSIKTMAGRPEALVVYLATTKGQAVDILWRKVKKALAAVALDVRFSETEKTVTLIKNGSVLKLAGADDDAEVNKLRGFQIAGIVIDEAAFHSTERIAYIIDEAVGPRLRGWVMMISSPGRVLAGTFYEATRPGGDHSPYGEPREEGWLGWSSHHWTLEEAAAFVEARGDTDSELCGAWVEAQRKKRAKKWGNDNPIWMREYLGIWVSDDTDLIFKYRPQLLGEAAAERKVASGTDWNQWDPPRRGALKIAELPAWLGDDWLFALAYDKGSGRKVEDEKADDKDKSRQDAFAVNAFVFSPSDPQKRILHVYCGEFVGFYARLFAELLVGDTDAYKRDGTYGEGSLFGVLGYPLGIVGDADATFIAELFRVYGIGSVEAKRQREQKHGAIELCNGDFVDGRIKVLKGSKLESQLQQVQWKADEFGGLTENKSQANNSTDCLVYGRKLIAHLFESGVAGDAKPAPDVARAPASPRRQPVALPDEPEERTDDAWWLKPTDYDGDDAWP